MKKILILALGTGSAFGRKDDNTPVEEKDRLKHIEVMIKEGKYNYKSANYKIEGIEEIQKSEFVAEPLQNIFKPDYTVIIGTVKSSWTNFYMKFFEMKTGEKLDFSNKEIYDDIRKINEIEETLGISTIGEKLKNSEAVINAIFKKRKIADKIILLRYGLNDEELRENYRLMGSLEKVFEENDEYEVAFDITHSFRSLPLYNLAILNYMKQLSSKKIQIKHVYYGNLDASHENNNISPIVDLIEAVNIMDLTNGVSEFKNTGNVITLLKLLPEGDLKEALKKLDWAMQINSFTKTEEAMKAVNRVLKTKNVSDTKYSDIKGMLNFILSSGLEKGKSLLKINEYSKGEAQLLLSKWYCKQHRYGIAAATGMEALRSILAPFYIELKYPNDKNKSIDNEAIRKAAVDRIMNVKNNFTEEEIAKSKIAKLFIKVGKAYKDITPIRNAFAHNLDEKDKSYKAGVEDDFEAAKEIIEEYMEELDEIYNTILKSKVEFRKAYKKERNKKIEIKNMRIVVSQYSGEELKKYLNKKGIIVNRSVQKDYNVYSLPKKLADLLKTNVSSYEEVYKTADTIYKYINKTFDLSSSIQVVFDNSISLGIKMVLISYFKEKKACKLYHIVNNSVVAVKGIENILKNNNKTENYSSPVVLYGERIDIAEKEKPIKKEHDNLPNTVNKVKTQKELKEASLKVSLEDLFRALNI